MSRTLVIAEPGCTHEGRKETLLRLLREAKACDVDVFKPQWVSNPKRMCERRHIGLDHPKRDYYLRAYSWLNFTVEWHAELSAECHALGMQYAVTCFLPEDVATVAPFADYLKIASFESEDDEMMEAVSGISFNERTIVSTGGSDGPAWGYLTFGKWLHCISAYPAPIDDTNLGVLGSDWCAGLSDHSRDLDMGMMAVCAGASIVETHFRLYDCDPENPDYPVAFDPGELAMYVAKVRKAERALGSGVKQIQPSEAWALPYRVGA